MTRSLMSSFREPRRQLLFLVVLLSTSLHAHSLVDVDVVVDAPAYVAASQSFDYTVRARALAYDFALGIVVRVDLPNQVAIQNVTANGWRCDRSGQSLTCSRDELPAGTSLITIRVSAPGSPGPLQASARIESVGSFDPNPANDRSQFTHSVYLPSSCDTSPITLEHPATESSGSPVHFRWSAVPGAVSYRMILGVEGERLHLVHDTTGTEALIPIQGGDVAWRVEALFNGCPTRSSDVANFRSLGPQSVLRIEQLPGRLSRPVAVTPFGAELLIVDEQRAAIYRRDIHGLISVYAGAEGVEGSADGALSQARFTSPRGVAVALGNYFYVADAGNHAIRQIYPEGFLFTSAGLPRVAGAVDSVGSMARFRFPSGIAVDESSTLFIADTQNHTIRRAVASRDVPSFFQATTLAGSAGVAGSSDGNGSSARFHEPSAVTLDIDGTLYVADRGNNAIRRVTAAGEVTTIASGFSSPRGIAIDLNGNLYVADTGNGLIRKIAPSGRVTTVATGFTEPIGISVDASGIVYLTDATTGLIYRGTPTVAGPRARAVRR